jgi:hypothetical protein
MTTNIIFTRYLYLKTGVLNSLENSILKNQYLESLFWAYEIYFSGFENEIFTFIFTIIERYFKEYPKLTNFLKKKWKEWEKDKAEDILGTIIKNICLRNYQLKEGKTRQVYVIINPKDIDNLKTKSKSNYMFLKTICIYDGIKTEKDESLLSFFRNDWLFYASFSPIWKKRILENNGVIDTENNTILFPDDDDSEIFYDNYGYEPDEQPIEIQERCIFT